MEKKECFFNIDDCENGIPRSLAAGINTRVFPGNDAMVSVVRIDPNAIGSIHSHSEEQWGYLIEGSAIRIQNGVEVEVNKEALRRLEAHYKKLKVELNESRIKMAKIPIGAELIDNPVSSAPGYIVKNIYVLPGVPKILQAMFAGLEDKICGVNNMISKNIVVHSAEGEIASLLENTQNQFKEVSIGSYPYFRPPDVGTNIVLRSLDINLINKASLAILKKLTEYKIQFEEN